MAAGPAAAGSCSAATATADLRPRARPRRARTSSPTTRTRSSPPRSRPGHRAAADGRPGLRRPRRQRRRPRGQPLVVRRHYRARPEGALGARRGLASLTACLSRPHRAGRGRRRRPARHLDGTGLPAGRPRRAPRRHRRPSTSAPPRGSVPGGRGRRVTGRSWSSSRSRPTTSARGDRRARWPATDAVVTDVGSVKSEPLAEVAAATGAGLRALRRRPPDGRQRAVRPAGRERRPVRRPPVGGHPARGVATRRRWRWSRSWSSVCGARPGAADARGARPGGGPDLAPAAPAGRRWWPAGSPTRPGATWRCPARGSATSPGSPAGDPALWQQIVAANADARAGLLGEVRGRAGPALRRGGRRATGPSSARCSRAGVAGTPAIPGKHGGPVRPTRSVFVSVPDHPGELARLFADAGESGVNIEDVHIDHDPGRPVGLVELVVERGPRPSTCWRRSNPTGLGDPPVGCRARAVQPARLPSAPLVVAIDGTVRVGQVEHLARRRRAAGAALPRHRRDVPRDDLVDAARRASTSTTPRAVAAQVRRARRSCPAPTRGGPTITVDGDRRRRARSASDGSTPRSAR